MKRLVIGILAHVDSGKTTLSEGLLFAAGEIGKLGRVDHKNAFLDTNEIERDRGITIFSHQAMINCEYMQISLLDTPGHVDFSAETERTLRVLDYAILVISASDGVQSHTETLWNLLSYYNIPTFIFVNKMDIASCDKKDILKDICKKLSAGCVDFGLQCDDIFENAATADEELFDEYMKEGKISDESLTDAVLSRKIFPCYFGSALKNEGVEQFLNGVRRFTADKNNTGDFGAKVFKIAEDEKGQRLTYLKITGGSLKVKTPLFKEMRGGKINEIRVYSGEKYTNVPEVFQGQVCAVTGLSEIAPGEGLGSEPDSEGLMSEPVLAYSVKLPPDTDINFALGAFRKLEQEETQLNVVWNERLQKLDVQVMGEVQLEVLKRILDERFGIKAEFEHGSIIYKETIIKEAEGVGHYEPLRHYSEVHLLLEPAERGSGLTFSSKCSEDILDKNWQRLILSHLAEKTHLGVLTGSPLTDVKITLINGRAHQKHTEGGDFRQATYRAVRQGLMQTESVLLEPYYSFTLEIPIDATGRAMTDLQQLGAEFEPPETKGDMSVIKGSAPICAIRDYHREVIAYTHGKGRFNCVFAGYERCHNSAEVIESIGYDPESDVDNTADSVFCSHGSGFVVKWDKVFEYMHIPCLKKEKEQTAAVGHTEHRRTPADEEELLRIFEMTYGKIKNKTLKPMRTPRSPTAFKAKPIPKGPEYLLIDGYNIIFAWDDLKAVAEENLDDAREILIRRICNYQAVRQNNVILVFDAYKVKGAQREVERIHGINVVYTKEAETADAYIEKTTQKLCNDHRVRVATSDNLEQIIIFGHGAVRVPASELLSEVEEAEKNIRAFIEDNFE